MWRLKIQTASITAASSLLRHPLVFRGLKACLPFGYSHLSREILNDEFVMPGLHINQNETFTWKDRASMDRKLNGRSELFCRGTLKRTFLERTRELVSKNSKLQNQCGSQGNYTYTKYVKFMLCI